MLDSIIPIIGSFLRGLFTYGLLPVFCLAFLACVPCLLRYFFFRR